MKYLDEWKTKIANMELGPLPDEDYAKVVTLLSKTPVKGS